MSRILTQISQFGAVFRSNLIATLEARVQHAFKIMIVAKKHEFEKEAGKLREAHKILKRDEVSYLRPYNYKPVA